MRHDSMRHRLWVYEHMVRVRQLTERTALSEALEGNHVDNSGSGKPLRMV